MVLFEPLRLHTTSGSRTFWHYAQGLAPAEPLSRLLPPVDRARRHCTLLYRGRTPAAHRLRHAGCAGSGSDAREAWYRIFYFGEGPYERPRGTNKALPWQRHV